MDIGFETHPISLSDRDKIETIRRQAGHTLSAHAFTSLYLWKDVMRLSICVGKAAYYIQYGIRGRNAWFSPCGASSETASFVCAMMDTPGFSLHYLRQEDVSFLEDIMPGRFRFEEVRGDEEYIYDRAAQVELAGGDFKNLRSKVHRARREASWTVCELGPAQRDVAQDVIRRWEHIRALTGDGNVASLGLKHFDELGLWGILLENTEGPQAVAYGSFLAADTFDLHVTKTIRPNLDAYLRWELFRRLPEHVRLINMEEDLDIPGLRTNKMEARPIRLARLWKGVPV